MEVMHIIFLLLALSIPLTSAADYPSIHIPIGVGEPQEGRDLSKPFGMFSADFTTCGKKTSDVLNPQFKNASIPSSVTFSVDCDPHPTRVIVANKATDFGTFTRKITEECELFTCSATDFPAKGADLGAITNGGNAKAASPPSKENMVCGAKQPQFAQGATGAFLFANEANCVGSAKSQLTRDSLWKTDYSTIPRWLKKDEDTFDLKVIYTSTEKTNHPRRLQYTFAELPTSEGLAGRKFHPCQTACEHGQLIKYTARLQSFKMLVHLTSTCPTFKVCFDPDFHDDNSKIPQCKPDFHIDVLVHSGAIVWGKTGRASLIELRSPNHDPADPVVIEFGYGVKRGAHVAADFYVGNDRREFVASDSAGYPEDKARRMAFFFPREDCLVKGAGIFSKNLENGQTLSKTAPRIVGGNYDENGEPITGSTNETATTPKPVAKPEALPHSTTKAPRQLMPNAENILGSSNLNNDGAYVTGKWWTWGLFFGFVTGTLITLGIGAAIFYFLRRTVYAIWYRGMYKRYGCDVDATTAGITGVGFGPESTDTVTLANTTGGGTIASTMGTTGGGTTAGATTGETTGADSAKETTSSSKMLEKDTSGSTIGL